MYPVHSSCGDNSTHMYTVRQSPMLGSDCLIEGFWSYSLICHSTNSVKCDVITVWSYNWHKVIYHVFTQIGNPCKSTSACMHIDHVSKPVYFDKTYLLSDGWELCCNISNWSQIFGLWYNKIWRASTPYCCQALFLSWAQVRMEIDLGTRLLLIHHSTKLMMWSEMLFQCVLLYDWAQSILSIVHSNWHQCLTSMCIHSELCGISLHAYWPGLKHSLLR